MGVAPVLLVGKTLALDRGHTNFREPPQGELRKIRQEGPGPTQGWTLARVVTWPYEGDGLPDSASSSSSEANSTLPSPGTFLPRSAPMCSAGGLRIGLRAPPCRPLRRLPGSRLRSCPLGFAPAPLGFQGCASELLGGSYAFPEILPGPPRPGSRPLESPSVSRDCSWACSALASRPPRPGFRLHWPFFPLPWPASWLRWCSSWPLGLALGLALGPFGLPGPCLGLPARASACSARVSASSMCPRASSARLWVLDAPPW
jgi:hypothetical protein